MRLCYQVATPEVRRELGTTAYQDEPAAALHAVAACGYDGVELMVRDPRVVDFGEIERLASMHRLDVPMVCTGEIFGQDRLTFADPNPSVSTEAIARVKATIDAAARFGAHANLGRARGGFSPDEDPAVTRRRILDAIHQVVDHAAKRDVVLALEPVNSLALNFINTTAEGLRLVREVGSQHFRLMLDSNHMFIDDADVEASIRLTGGDVAFVHLADSNRRYPGNCKLDFAAFLANLRAVGYDGWLGVEVFPVPDQEAALRLSIEHLAPIVHRLTR